MAYMVDSLLKVAAAGGSLVIGEGYMVDSVIQIAQTLKGNGGHLTIKSQKYMVDSMIKICRAAPGQVTFDLS
ncbi:MULTISPECIES: hypothetical protein [unclassified Pseudomonas]|jgi:hypothetical protein|uniref:Uncharacterized protein n=1 Tax=Pseudomonas gorinensis TaxID=3240790 RepID=A0ACA7P8Z9_9PSED|nr:MULTISPECIES: hypothetical protein [unclassified Pseudomonas]AHC36480.1 hypothetical protein U771_19845 [Pseudomonas sp. TKP]MBL1307187.1 hypothetical protein [Pseudomonas sp.]PMX14850.1 hypothetical protein C1Y25_13455 [Pseudomonas sp. MPBC4-3]PMX49760.1 hypothetical protein C1Y20_05875 [Pseudomonas sp. FW301-21B01]PMY05740.1 hypothetical protein C1Y18_18560 [Pseudomonas sp. MPR-R5A]